MVFDNRNLAYDLRLFEDEMNDNKSSVATEKVAEKKAKPEKLNSATDSQKKHHKRIKRRKNNFIKISGAVVFALAVVVVVSLIIHGQVQLTELNQQISNAQKTLEEQQSLYTQLEMKVDASISTSVVEDYAQTNLGMSKVENSQKEFIALSQGDKVEIAQDQNKGFWDSLSEAFSSLWS